MSELPQRARHDPMICGLPGLFRSLVRGTREGPLKIVHEFGSETVELTSPVHLGCDDLRVLQAVMALATTARIAIDADTKNASARKLRSGLRLGGDATARSVLLVEASLARLSLAAGYGKGRGGAMGAQLRAALGRLAGCRLRVASDRSAPAWNLLAWDENGTDRNRLRIALNPRSSRCARGDIRFTLIDMHEARALREDVARLLHQRLSGWIDAIPNPRSDKQAPRHAVRLVTLADYAWQAKTKPSSGAASRQRRVALHSAIGQLKQIGWHIDEVDVGGDTFTVRRPARLAA